MGVILDSSVIIRAERLKRNEETMVEEIYNSIGVQDIALTTVVVTEILHGVYRARDIRVRRIREAFLDQLIEDFPVYPYTVEIARFAGRIDGEQAAVGNTLPFADMLIGATALYLGYSILTANPRDFRKIPGLNVIAF